MKKNFNSFFQYKCYFCYLYISKPEREEETKNYISFSDNKNIVSL